MASIIKRAYKVKLPSGKVVTRKCEHYTIQYRDAAGKIQRVKGYKDKAATVQLAAKLEKARERGEQGLVDQYREHRERPTAEHVAEYVADLKAAGRDEKYIDNADKRLAILIDACGWKTLGDVDPNSFIRWRETAAKEHVAPGRLGKGAAATTLNQYLDPARAITNWCAQPGRLPGIPVGKRKVAEVLAGLAKVSGEKRRKRRALADEQVTALLAVAGDRAIVYRVGLSIGLRRSEFEALVWGDLHLNAIKPYVQLRAEATKARRADALPVPQSLADDLRRSRPHDATDASKVFPTMPTIEQWKADLAAAGIVYRDDMGRVADFHGGTRKTLCSRMHRAGVPLAVAMRRMRHTDAKLTMVDYTDDAAIGMEAGVLPELAAATPTTTASATGTG